MFNKAFALDSEYGVAYAMAAMCVFHHKMSGVVPATEAEIADGVRLARLAAVKGAQDAVALAWAGYALTYLAGDVEGGLRLTERACVLNPNSLPRGGVRGGTVSMPAIPKRPSRISNMHCGSARVTGDGRLSNRHRPCAFQCWAIR